MKYIIITLLFTSIMFSKSYCQSFQSEGFEKIDDNLEEIMDSLVIVGLNYAVLIDHKVVHENSFGLANLQLQVPMTLNNTFPVASISKLFSSVALYNLLAINNRDVNEKVKDFISKEHGLPELWMELTLKQLLSHTSGIPDQIDYQIYLAPESEGQVVDALKDKPFSSKPGSESKYNATGYLLIRMIVEKLADQDFETYMQEQYFDKLKLKSAIYGGFKNVIPKRVTCYHNVGGKLEMFPLNYSSPMYAAAGLNINIHDLIVWFQAIVDAQILNKTQIEDIWTPVALNNGEEGQFGLGWESYRLQDNYRMVGHGGAGISSLMHYWNEETKQNVTVILLTNGALNWAMRPNQINLQIASMILDE